MAGHSPAEDQSKYGAGRRTKTALAFPQAAQRNEIGPQ